MPDDTIRREAAFTPGPWRILQPTMGFSAIEGPGGELIFGLAAGCASEKQSDDVCAANAHLIRVDPRNTSQRCSGCSELVPKSLAVRIHVCPHCGLVIDRDWNASLNILRAGMPAGWIT